MIGENATEEREWLFANPNLPNPNVEVVLAEYESRQTQEERIFPELSREELGRRRDEFLVSVGRSTGILLDLLIRESQAHSILELGTGFGYSTVWLAQAAQATGGHVVSVDLVAEKHQFARSALKRAGLVDAVDFQLGDAIDFLGSSSDTYDFVLLDVWKDLYIPCIDSTICRLRAGAIIVADNMLKPGVVRLSAAKYQAHVLGITDLRTIVLPVGSGLAISRFRA